MPADSIFFNGRIVTMSPEKPDASAFAVVGDRFRAVGSDDQIRQLAGARTQAVDLEGRTVVPGFIETHSHLSLYAMTLLQADCKTPPNQNIDDIKHCIAEVAATTEPDKWIKGWGYDDTLIAEKRHLTVQDLDETAPDHPVFVSHTSGHLAYINSKAMAVSGIDAHTPQPEGGEIDKDDNGVPTGLLKEEGALALVMSHIPPYTVSELRDAFKRAIGYYHRFGVTSTHDGAIGYFRHGPQVMRTYWRMHNEGELNIRVYLTLIEEIYRKLLKLGIGRGFGSDLLKMGSLKLFQDGSIQALTAALNEPYRDRPDISGELLIDQEKLNRCVKEYNEDGLQIAIHANGDRAVESVLQAFESARKHHPVRANRHMVVHSQLATAGQILRMKKLGLIPNFFVNHVYYWGDRHESIFLGPDRAKRIDPLNTALEQGVLFCLHSDLPVTPVNPLFSIHCAVNRVTRNGKVLGSRERIPPDEGLKAYTTNAAFCSFEEHRKGVIAPGKLADFAVLSGNPLSVPPESIKDIQVLMTYLGGNLVYANNSGSNQ
jgi:predicted amidohydrolase YtcJ